MLDATTTAHWRVLDCQFGSGRHFLETWARWQADPQAVRWLHYVALTESPPTRDELLAQLAEFPALHASAAALSAQCYGLTAGFHRLTLADGHLLLTLCVGPPIAMLREQQFMADAVYLGAPDQQPSPNTDPGWDRWRIKALARCCRRGTTLTGPALGAALRADLRQGGFELADTPDNDSTPTPLTGQFNPRWALKNTRHGASQTRPPGRCAVIGAGLAGASVAAALAQRGWQVQVLDSANAPAAGASGLPVGLVVPHASVDDCPLSRLSRSGVRLMLAQARQRLTAGQDWDATGVMERQFEGAADRPSLWHAQAAWLKPTAMVNAWLQQPGVTFQGNAHVAALRPEGKGWALLDAQGGVLCCADRVIFANASGAKPLIDALDQAWPELALHKKPLAGMHGLLGQLSWGLHAGLADQAFPATPVNGLGSVVCRVPVAGGAAWYVGSSYQPDQQVPLTEAKNQAANLARLKTLLPELGQALAPSFASAQVHAWRSTRCVTADRLPVVGPLQAGDDASLWLCAGMGSRGMSFAVLCAQLLAARWGAEPLAVEASLSHSLDAWRGRPSQATAADNS